MKTITARNKGLITGTIMILISIGIYLAKKDFDNGLQYIVYATYVAGILWTLLIFKKEAGDTATFKACFSEGFKCFIVVTFLMVLFTLVFILIHPELKVQMAAIMRVEYAKDINMAPLDIENRVNGARKFFLPGYLMGAVLSYLAIGALVTLITVAFLSRKKIN